MMPLQPCAADGRSRRREEAEGRCVHEFRLLMSAATDCRFLKLMVSLLDSQIAHRGHEPARCSGTGFQPVFPGILPSEGTGAGSPGDRLEACPSFQRFMEKMAANPSARSSDGSR